MNFRTVRPADYSTPYETLLKNQVHFAAVDKGNNRLLNVMVRPPHGPHSNTRGFSVPQKIATGKEEQPAAVLQCNHG